MRNVTLKIGYEGALRVALQFAICFLVLLAFFFAQSQSPALSALSAGIPEAMTTPSARSILSNATATRTPTIRKTSSPTLSSASQVQQSAPVSPRLPRAPVLDANTVALYHFDNPGGSVAIDATGNYTGTLVGTAVITNTALFGTGALYTNGRDGPGPGYVQVGNMGDLSVGTLEAYIDFQAACQGIADHFSIISAGNGYGGGQQLRLSVGGPGQTDNWLDFGLLASNGFWHWVTSGINPCKYLAFPTHLPWPYDVWRWHHVAATWGPRSMEIWVDGVLHGVGYGASAPPYAYFCNPQQQVSSFHYPNCDVPPFSLTPIAPGFYTGGLASSAYTTWLIGCDGIDYCFKGRIDDVRISNIQRGPEYLNISVDPPSSPTPTQTPVAITGEYGLDVATISLHHLNASANRIVADAMTSNPHNGALAGNASITPGGRFGNGLSLDGRSSYVSLWNAAYYPVGTVEAWIGLCAVTGSFGVVSGGTPFGYRSDTLFLGTDFSKSDTLRFGILDNSPNPIWHWADSGISPSTLVYAWHHVASTWGPQGMEIWVDGVLRGTNGYAGERFVDSYGNPFVIGCDVTGNCVQGMIDEVRFSSVQRTYAPPILGSSPLRRGFAPIAPNSGVQAPFQFFLPFVQVNPFVPVNNCP
jgi:hypothetical protein